MDLGSAIVRGFEIGVGIVAAVAVLMLAKIAMIIIQSVIEVCAERAEREKHEDTK